MLYSLMHLNSPSIVRNYPASEVLFWASEANHCVMSFPLFLPPFEEGHRAEIFSISQDGAEAFSISNLQLLKVTRAGRKNKSQNHQRSVKSLPELLFKTEQKP